MEFQSLGFQALDPGILIPGTSALGFVGALIPGIPALNPGIPLPAPAVKMINGMFHGLSLDGIQASQTQTKQTK